MQESVDAATNAAKNAGAGTQEQALVAGGPNPNPKASLNPRTSPAGDLNIGHCQAKPLPPVWSPKVERNSKP